MEEERNQNQSVASGEEGREMEVKDRGLFDFMGKKEEKEKEKEKSEEEYLVAGMEKVRVDEVEDKEEKKKEGLLEKLHRSHSSSSSSSSSSDEEGGGEGENKEKKKKKKGLKGKIKEKIGADKEEEEKETVHVVAKEEFVQAVPASADDDTAVTVEVVEGTVKLDGAADGGEKKGFLEKIKEKLPGHKKPSEEAAPTVETAVECAKERDDAVDANEGKENKKGFLGKIMEKLPGYNKGGEEKEKEKETEKTSACN